MKRFRIQTGEIIKVDDCDAYLLRSKVWRSSGNGPRKVVLTGHAGIGRQNYLSHRILGTFGDVYVVHINHDSFDFTRANLRLLPKEEALRQQAAYMRSLKKAAA